MRKLWKNWRGWLYKDIKSKLFRDALKDVPNEEKSARNSVNRSKLTMPHCTGRKSIREIIYELYLGLEYQMKFDLATMFFLSKSVGLDLIKRKRMIAYLYLHRV
ncbi:uncharacterized protein [Nicotiana sylvestris]|uniref:Uncharacterized protein LOC104248048 isoform X2 n=1 Tax=Nicotiana sylvestris TaxID=4096 RepID=A0A1U7YTK2_NICSY|nr:PREDICTED: uncharacterized protein LOC104248048 isoform X2 [Nicotiana sylvestris]